jgi:hypothetical protein
VSIQEFQRAFADLIADPRQCIEARSAPKRMLAGYDLTCREQERLAKMVWDEGMSINCTLYRVNRLTPVYSVMPLTCRLLGDKLSTELDAFWVASRNATLQYRWEAWRFGSHLLERIAQGLLSSGPVEDAIRFELASYDVQAQDDKDNEHERSSRQRLVTLRYDPDQLFDPSVDPSALRPLAASISVLLDASGPTLTVRRLHPEPVVAVGFRR